MSLKKFEKLENLLTDYVAEIHKLQAEKNRLAGEVNRLQNEIKSTVSKYEKANDSLRKLTFLENANKKMQSDKTAIRAKIKDILNNLEQMDFI